MNTDWTAKWSWVDTAQESDGQDSHIFFRRRFTVTNDITSCQIKVSADSRYILYVNGKKVGRGPLKGDLQHYYYEMYDLIELLTAGNNVIAVHIHLNTGHSSEVHSGRGAFLCDGTVIQADGTCIDLCTPGEWKATFDTGWIPSNKKRSRHLGYINYFDARYYPNDWMTPDFKDENWLEVTPVCTVPDGVWNLTLRDYPQLKESQIAPANEELIWQDTGDGEKELTIDYGVQLSAFAALEVTGSQGAELDISYSETPGKEIGPPDRIILSGGRDRFESFHYTGYRYLILRSHSAEKIDVHSAQSLLITYPAQCRGQFECSDDDLNRIWQMGKLSITRCLHETFEDCPGYEQLQFWGDAHVEALVWMTCYGDPKPFERGLRLLSWSKLQDGILQSRYPTTRESVIPTFALIWILSLKEYLYYVGNREFLDEMWPTAKDALAWFRRYVKQMGVLEDVEHWVFLDWAGNLCDFRKGASAILNGYYHGALLAAEELACWLGDSQTAQQYHKEASQLRTAYRKVFYNENLSTFADDMAEGCQGKAESQHTPTAAILYGLADENEYEALVFRMLDKSLAQASPYFMSFVFRALKKSGHYHLAINEMRRWKIMLDAGATTCWENWENTRSWCHAWSASPTYELSTEILGVYPTAPGWKTAAIKPFCGDLQFAKGTVPTPYGDIKVSWEKTNGRVNLEYSAPREISIQTDETL